MSNIRFFALGGLGENGKNMYCIEAGKDLYILDAGLKYPSSNMYGVDEIIPDYRMLRKAQKRIRGIFLSHAHEDHIGAISYMIDDFNVPIFGSRFTLEVLLSELKGKGIDVKEKTFVEIKEDSVFQFENSKISFFNTAHSIPGSVGFAIHTHQGVIVYTSEYTLNQTTNSPISTSFSKLSDLSKEGVLLLLNESVGSSTYHSSHNVLQLDHILNGIFTHPYKRIFIALFATDFKQIQKVFDLSLSNNKRIIIVGEKGKKVIELAIKFKALSLPSKYFVGLKDEGLENEQLVIILAGSKLEPFTLLQNIVSDKDKNLKFKESDKIVLMTTPIPGTEKTYAKTLDILYRTDSDITAIPQRLLSSSHATEEEIKIMINILNPRYIVPVIGEYRHQYGFKHLVKSLNFPEENLFLMDNGDTLNIISKNDVYISKGDINTSEILIDGTPLDDEKDVVVRDRVAMADDGTLILVAHIDPKEKKVIGEPEIVTKGFIYLKESEDVIENIKKVFFEVSEKQLSGKYINWNDYKHSVKEEISKYAYQVIKRNPIIIPVIVAVE